MLFQQWDYEISSPALFYVCRKLHFLDEISKYHKCKQYKSCVKLGSEISLTTRNLVVDMMHVSNKKKD
jgi:hypothetical protein